MIHKNERPYHPPQTERKYALYFHGFTDRCVAGFDNNFYHADFLRVSNKDKAYSNYGINFAIYTTKTGKMAKKILIVDDEGQIGLILNMILAERDLDLAYANSLLAAEEYLEKNSPAIIILDNKLPDGFGVDFISYIKNKYPSIRIIMISGFGTVGDVALENGADLFIEKPFSMEKINDAINQVLG